MARMCFAATFRTPDQPAYGPGLRFRAAMPTDTVNHGRRPGNAQKLPAARMHEPHQPGHPLSSPKLLGRSVGRRSDGGLKKFRCKQHADMCYHHFSSLGRPRRHRIIVLG